MVNEHFTKEKQSRRVWGADRWPAYFMDEVVMDDHQICIAHLLQNLTYTMRAFPDDAWSLNMLNLLRYSVHQRNKGVMESDVRRRMESRLDKLLARSSIYTGEDGKDAALDKFKKSIDKHRNHIFTFLINPIVPPTSNDREKALLPRPKSRSADAPYRGRRRKLRHRRVCHSDHHQKQAKSFRGPACHRNYCSGVVA